MIHFLKSQNWKPGKHKHALCLRRCFSRTTAPWPLQPDACGEEGWSQHQHHQNPHPILRPSCHRRVRIPILNKECCSHTKGLGLSTLQGLTHRAPEDPDTKYKQKRGAFHQIPLAQTSGEGACQSQALKAPHPPSSPRLLKKQTAGAVSVSLSYLHC